MRILIINTTDKGGAAKACIRLHKGLLAAGIESKLLLLYKFDHSIPESYSALRNSTLFSKIKFKVARKIVGRFNRVLLANKPEGHYGFSSAKQFVLKDELLEWADIINLHWVAHFIDWRTFFKQRKKIVWTLHDMVPFTAGCHHSEGCEKFKASCQNCPQLNDASASKSQQQLAIKKKADLSQLHVVGPSKWILDQSRESTLFKHAAHSLIPNSISYNRIKTYNKEEVRRAYNLPLDAKIILFVAQNLSHPLKGLHYLQKAIPMLECKNIHLVLVGKGEFEGENLTHYYYNKDEEFLNKIYASADLFVTSSVLENLPSVISESLTCGTPVVGFNVGGIPEMIVEGENGLVCPVISAEALSKTIDAALKINFDKEKISQDALKLYNPKQQAKQYIDLFRACMVE